jgi:hypothetical protein
MTRHDHWLKRPEWKDYTNYNEDKKIYTQREMAFENIMYLFAGVFFGFMMGIGWGNR